MIDLSEYIVCVIVGICLCVGFIIKSVIRNEKLNRYIPIIVATLGVILNIWINGTVTPDIILGGMISGLSSTGFYEAFNQFIEQ